MSGKPRSPAPIPRIPGLGFVKLARRLSNSSARRSREADITPNDDDWYIPYNGTYEPPKATLKQRKERDSWGDPIYGDDDEEGTTVASLESPIRYHADRDALVRGKPCRDSGLDSEDQRTSYRHRSNTHSAITGQTTLVGTLHSANRASYSTTKRRSTVHSRPPMPSYINLDAAGGVGASPAPPPVPEQRKRSPSKEAKALSVASIFSGTSSARRKSISSSAGSIFRKLSRGPPPSPSLPCDVKNDKVPRSHRRSSSDSTHMLTRTTSPLRRGRVGAPAIEESHHRYGTTQKPVDSNTTSKDPFIDYNTHAHEPTPAPAPARHPYASVFPAVQQFDEPRTAPLPGAMTSQGQASSNYKTLPRGTEFASSSGPRPHFGFLTSRSLRIGNGKNSASTPDLRLFSATQAKEKEAKNAGKSAGGSKDRWLSPETWCDALLFPRPRLKMKLDSELQGPRPMSTWEFPDSSKAPEPRQAVASRVLAQSQSHHNLRVPRTSPQKVARREDEPGPSKLRITADQAAEKKASRPKSFSWDDMALPTPVPSLTKVLEDGERLDSERKEWQHQATRSFQNRRSRSVSRARSKSLSQQQQHKGSNNLQESWAENMDFLAARACLGKQIDMPSITIKISTPDSPQKSPSKKDKHHKHTHTDSWSRSAFKNTQPGIGRGGAPVSHQKYPSADTGSTTSLVGASRRAETRVVRQPDPAQPAYEHLALSEDTHNARISPSPSGTSSGDVRMGIALSTPPMVNNAEDMESLSMPSHPYAQGGFYTSRHYPTQISHSPTNTPSPTPSQGTHGRDGTPTQGSPQYLQFSHPYAQRSPSQNSYISEAKILPVPRLDSDVPPPAKMWIPVAPGLVTEVLPGEISYSPFLPEHEIGDTQNSEDTHSTVEMAEVLALTSDPQVDSVANHPYSSELSGRRPLRQPVQYDTSRPYLSHAKTSETNHTLASSGLLRANSDPATQLLSPPLPRQESSGTGSGSGSIIHIRTTSTSPESPSPPVSPRPFDNPDALDNFHDLFYRSRHHSERQSQATVSSSTSGFRSRRGGSGLTSLARQISEELMELEMEREREGSQYSFRASFDRPSLGPSRRPTGSSLEFVFEENPRLGIAPGEEIGSTGGPIASTFSSIGVPEDVESSRASSPLDPHAEDDNETEEGPVQVRSVEPFLTPPAIYSPQRTSMTGHLSIPEDHEEAGEDDQRIIDYNLLDHTGERDSNLLSPGTRYSSGHRHFSVDLLRSSYITTSTMSRMSGLSDFPEPPTIPTGSMLNNFFDKGDTPPSPPPPLPIRTTDNMATIKRQRRLTLGGIEEDYSSTAPSSPVSPISPVSPASHASSRS